MPAHLHLLRIGILAYFAALFGAAFFVAWKVLASAAENPDCAIRHCKRFERAGDWFAALTGDALWAASMSFTGVVVLGLVVFAIPWVVYREILKRRGMIK